VTATRAGALERLAARSDVPFALMLTGGRADRLESDAIRLAAAWLCPREDDPERRCGSCRRVFDRTHPDLLVLVPDGLQIRIDQVREALAFAAGRPYESARRVAVIPRAELLGLEASNALLKGIEEPGARMRWILTAVQPEMLLPTIRSRCVSVRVAPDALEERAAAWRERGATEEDLADRTLLDSSAEPDRETLQAARAWRAQIVEALVSGVGERDLAALVLLGDSVARADAPEARRLAELLADAAVIAAGGPEDSLRHPSVAGRLRAVAAAAPPAALQAAAMKAADAPPDRRRGNLRFHYEGLLLELFLAGSTS
jgi:hypothetical protein